MRRWIQDLDLIKEEVSISKFYQRHGQWWWGTGFPCFLTGQLKNELDEIA